MCKTNFEVQAARAKYGPPRAKMHAMRQQAEARTSACRDLEAEAKQLYNEYKMECEVSKKARARGRARKGAARRCSCSGFVRVQCHESWDPKATPALLVRARALLHRACALDCRDPPPGCRRCWSACLPTWTRSWRRLQRSRCGRVARRMHACSCMRRLALLSSCMRGCKPGVFAPHRAYLLVLRARAARRAGDDRVDS